MLEVRCISLLGTNINFEVAVLTHVHVFVFLQSHDPLVNEYEGLLKVWLAMQKTVCGKKPVSKEKIEKFEETNKFGTNNLYGLILCSTHVMIA